MAHGSVHTSRSGARRWLCCFLGLASLLLGGLFALNVYYDPYLVFARADTVASTANPERSRLVSYSYVAKAAQIIRERPAYILLGTSVVDGGFVTQGSMANQYAPDPQAYRRMQALLAPYHPVYNAALRGKNMQEAFEYLEHAYANNPDLKEVYLGTDWTMFLNGAQSLASEVGILGKTHVTLDYLLQYSLSVSSTLLAWDMLKADFPDIVVWQTQAETYFTYPVAAPVTQRFTPVPVPAYQYALKAAGDSEVNTFVFTAWYAAVMLHPAFDNPALDPTTGSFEYIHKIVDFCHARHITLKVFITTKHPFFWEFVKEFGLLPREEDWLRRLVRVAPVWDFSGAVDFGPDPDKYHAGDSLHFNHNGGELILPQLLHAVPSLPGVTIVTPDNVEQMITQYRGNMERWEASHPHQAASVHSMSLPRLLAFRTFPPKPHYWLMPVFYQPDYKGFRILQFMTKFIAVPVKDAENLSLDDAVQYQSHGWKSADSIEQLITRMDAH